MLRNDGRKTTTYLILPYVFFVCMLYFMYLFFDSFLISHLTGLMLSSNSFTLLLRVPNLSLPSPVVFMLRCTLYYQGLKSGFLFQLENHTLRFIACYYFFRKVFTLFA